MAERSTDLGESAALTKRQALSSQLNLACARGELTAAEAEEIMLEFDREEYLSQLPHTD